MHCLHEAKQNNRYGLINRSSWWAQISVERMKVGHEKTQTSESVYEHRIASNSVELRKLTLSGATKNKHAQKISARQGNKETPEGPLLFMKCDVDFYNPFISFCSTYFA